MIEQDVLRPREPSCSFLLYVDFMKAMNFFDKIYAKPLIFVTK